MAVAAHPVTHPRLDPAEFEALQLNAGWEMDVELIDGQAVVVPPLGGAASSAQGNLYFELRRWNIRRSEPGLLLQDVFVALPDGSVPAPDICWWSPEHGAEVVQGPIRIVPDLVVEVLSPSTRANDLGPKRDLYAKAGVRELWLADPDARTITLVRPGSGTAQTLGVGDTLGSELLDGFALAVEQVF